MKPRLIYSGFITKVHSCWFKCFVESQTPPPKKNKALQKDERMIRFFFFFFLRQVNKSTSNIGKHVGITCWRFALRNNANKYCIH